MPTALVPYRRRRHLALARAGAHIFNNRAAYTQSARNIYNAYKRWRSRRPKGRGRRQFTKKRKLQNGLQIHNFHRALNTRVEKGMLTHYFENVHIGPNHYADSQWLFPKANNDEPTDQGEDPMTLLWVGYKIKQRTVKLLSPSTGVYNLKSDEHDHQKRRSDRMLYRGFSYTFLLENVATSAPTWVRFLLLEERKSYKDYGSYATLTDRFKAQNPGKQIFSADDLDDDGNDFNHNQFDDKQNVLKINQSINRRKYKVLMDRKLKLMPKNNHVVVPGTTTVNESQACNFNGSDSRVIRGYKKINRVLNYTPIDDIYTPPIGPTQDMKFVIFVGNQELFGTDSAPLVLSGKVTEYFCP